MQEYLHYSLVWTHAFLLNGVLYNLLYSDLFCGIMRTKTVSNCSIDYKKQMARYVRYL